MTRSVTLTPAASPRFTVKVDDAGDLKIVQDGKSVIIGGDWETADLFNAIRFITGHKTK